MIAPKPYQALDGMMFSISHMDDTRLAAIAGVHRSVLWTRPKLYQQK